MATIVLNYNIDYKVSASLPPKCPWPFITVSVSPLVPSSFPWLLSSLFDHQFCNPRPRVYHYCSKLSFPFFPFYFSPHLSLFRAYSCSELRNHSWQSSYGCRDHMGCRDPMQFGCVQHPTHCTISPLFLCFIPLCSTDEWDHCIFILLPLT